jgi:hypothetical protein
LTVVNLTVPAVLMLAGLIVLTGVPLAIGVLAAHSNSRHAATGGANRLFWGLLAALLGTIAFWGYALYTTVDHFQPEGYGELSFGIVVTVWGLPFSVLYVVIGTLASTGSLPRPFGLSSMSVWLVLGSLCWQFLFVVGIRWLTLTGARRSSRAAPMAPESSTNTGEPPS